MNINRFGTYSSEVGTSFYWWAHSASTPGYCTMTSSVSRWTSSAQAGLHHPPDTTGMALLGCVLSRFMTINPGKKVKNQLWTSFFLLCCSVYKSAAIYLLLSESHHHVTPSNVSLLCLAITLTTERLLRTSEQLSLDPTHESTTPMNNNSNTTYTALKRPLQQNIKHKQICGK